jgi:hypothetical protein
LRKQLHEITHRYEQLDPAPASGDGTRSRPGFGSHPPASLHILAITDPRSKPCEVARDAVQYVLGPDGEAVDKVEVWFGADGRAYQESSHPVVSPAARLGGWAAWISEETGHTLTARTVPDLVAWLDRRLDWLTRQEEITEFAVDVRRLAGELMSVTGDPRYPVGRCPNTIDEGDHTRECGARLWLHGETVRCHACDRPWPRSKWMELADLLEAS